MFEPAEHHSNVSQGPAIDSCVCDASETKGSHTVSYEGMHIIQGPCECSVVIAMLAALLDKDYGSDNPRKVDPLLLPSDKELSEIYNAYTEARGKCSRCGPGASLDSKQCTCLKAWDRRQQLIYLIDISVDDWAKYIPIYRSQFPEIDLNWVYESKRCLACK